MVSRIVAIPRLLPCGVLVAIVPRCETGRGGRRDAEHCRDRRRAHRPDSRAQHRRACRRTAGRRGRCRMPRRRARLAEACGARAMSLDEAFAADAVLIGSPTPTHADYIERAATAGRAIFCEKPIDLAVRPGARVPGSGAARRRGADGRFQPPLRSAFRGIEAAAWTRARSATLELLTIISRDPAPPPPSYVATSGGLFRDMMIHDLDMARFLLGEEPVGVARRGFVPGRSGDRRRGRCGYRRGDAADRGRQAVPDFQLAPRELWLRPAHRGAWRQGPAAGRQRHRRPRWSWRPRPALSPIRCCRSSWSVMPRPIAPSLMRSSRRVDGSSHRSRMARTA